MKSEEEEVWNMIMSRLLTSAVKELAASLAGRTQMIFVLRTVDSSGTSTESTGASLLRAEIR
jgi:hypothetical protein